MALFVLGEEGAGHEHVAHHAAHRLPRQLAGDERLARRVVPAHVERRIALQHATDLLVELVERLGPLAPQLLHARARTF